MYLFFIIIGVLGIAGIAYIVIRKSLSISLIDIEKQVSKTKKIKDTILASRFNRLLKERGKKPKELLKGATGKLKNYFEKTVDKLIEIEKKSTRTLTKDVEKPKGKKDKQQEKIDELMNEASNLREVAEDWKQVEGKYVEILKLDPKNIDAYKELAKLYLENNKVFESRQILEFLLKLGVEDADVYINLANLAWEEDNLDEAKQYYIKALSIDGTKVIARMNLGLIYNQSGDKDSAIQQFKAAMELEPKNPKYLDLLIESAIKIGDMDLAKQALSNLRAVNPENKKIKEFKERIQQI